VAAPPGPNIPNLRLPSRDKAIEAAIAEVEKAHGSGTVMRLNDRIASFSHEVCPSGLLGFDKALGGGWPFGRIVEVYGPEGGGKTTLILHAIASCQRLGGTAALLDAEHSFDPTYAKALGVDVSKLLVSQPDYGEQVFEVMEPFVAAGINLIAVDSVAALTPKAELEGEIGDQHVGLQARMMNQALRRFTAKVSKAKTLLMFINQLRMKIGMHGYGSPEETPGGKALKYYASVRVDVRPTGKFKRGEEVAGHEVFLKVVKNKLAPPFQKCDARLVFGKGFWRAGEVVDLAAEYGIIEKSGAWYSYQGERIGQGRDNVADYLEARPEVLGGVEAAVRTRMYATEAT